MIRVGDKFILDIKDPDPWARSPTIVTVVEIKDGWVRYDIGNVGDLWAKREKDFLAIHAPYLRSSRATE